MVSLGGGWRRVVIDVLDVHGLITASRFSVARLPAVKVLAVGRLGPELKHTMLEYHPRIVHLRLKLGCTEYTSTTSSF